MRAAGGPGPLRRLARVPATAIRGRRHLVQVGAVRPGPDPGVDEGPRYATWRRRASDAPLPRAGSMPGARGRGGPGDGPPDGGRRPGHRAGTVRADPAAEGEPGGAHRTGAGAEQSLAVAVGRLAAGPGDRGPAAAEPARPRGTRGRLACRLRRDITGHPRHVTGR